MVKSQTIRMLDVWVIGPLMLYAGVQGLRRQRVCPTGNLLLAAFGATTIWYNWRNYQKIKAWEAGHGI